MSEARTYVALIKEFEECCKHSIDGATSFVTVKAKDDRNAFEVVIKGLGLDYYWRDAIDEGFPDEDLHRGIESITIFEVARETENFFGAALEDLREQRDRHLSKINEDNERAELERLKAKYES